MMLNFPGDRAHGLTSVHHVASMATESHVPGTYFMGLMDSWHQWTDGIISLMACIPRLSCPRAFLALAPPKQNIRIYHPSGCTKYWKAVTFQAIWTEILTSRGRLPADPDDCDVTHFLMGLGEGGLASLFEKLTVLAWAVAFAEGASLVAPWIEHSPFSTLVTEGAAERLADFFVRLLPRL
jgi:hypothetical protein